MEFDFERNFHRPVPEYVLQKQKIEINGQQFLCYESHYEGELINGVDLRVKQLKGLPPKASFIDYFKETQQLIFCLSSSLVTYNTHKKVYQHLLNVEGELVMLKRRFDRLNNREYLIWVQKNVDESQPVAIVGKRRANKGNGPKETKLKKKGTVAFLKEEQIREQNMACTMFSGFIGSKKDTQTNEKQYYSRTGFNKLALRKARSSIRGEQYTLKVYDYTKRELVYESPIKIQQERIVDLFLFFNQVKAIGFILEDEESHKKYIYYRNFNRKSKKVVEKHATFECMTLVSNIDHLIYNEEEACYLFNSDTNIFKFTVHQSSDQEKRLKDIFLNEDEDNVDCPIKVALKKQVQIEYRIVDMTTNDQYVVVLTDQVIYFYSAFDSQSLIFTHNLEELSAPALGIYLNKNSLLMTHIDSSVITTFVIRNKTLKVQNSTILEINHCRKIVNVFQNSINFEIYCVVEYFQREGRIRNKQIKNPNTVQYDLVPAQIDICACYLSPASKTQTKCLKLAKQNFKKLHESPWISKYILETEDSLYFGNWRQTFQNKRCLCIHPTGIYAVVGFKEAFKIYTISYQGISNTYKGDSINDIQDCAISPFGNHLAVAATNTVFIYDFYSCRRLKSVTLPLGVCIQTLNYKSNYLCVTLKTKKQYIYDMELEYKQLIAFNPKNYLNDPVKEQEFMAAAISSMYNIANLATQINAIHFDAQLKIIIYSAKNNLYFFNILTTQIIFFTEMDPITCFFYCKNLKTLFLGTAKGEIVSFIWPNKPGNIGQHKKIKLHAGSIVAILVTSDMTQLISIADDHSLCTCHLTYIKNRKRFEGLQLLESLSGGLTINFNFLSRKGICQYTHTHLGAKLDQIKDYEDQTINLNFIMPEERAKQKEQMLGNVKNETFKLTQVNGKQYQMYKNSTNAARDQVNQVRDVYEKFMNRSKMEMKKMKEEMFTEYMNKYQSTKQSQKLLKELQEKYKKAKKKQQQCLEFEMACQNDRFESEYNNLKKQFERQKQYWCQQKPEQLAIIDEEKKDFIEHNVKSLEEMLTKYHVQNSSLSCRNSNIQKEIIMLKRKMQEQRYLLYRLRSNTDILLSERERYDLEMKDKKNKLEKQDKVNFVDIEKEYVKQTKILIEKDKQVDVKIFTYKKEKNILVYLEKCVKQLEQNIEQIVDNLMSEQKQGKQDLMKVRQISKNAEQIMEVKLEKSKKLTISKNSLKSYLFQIGAASDALLTDRKANSLEILTQKNLLDAEYATVEEVDEADIILQKDIEEKIVHLSADKYNWINDGGNKHRESLDNMFKQYRKLKTETNQRFKRDTNYSSKSTGKALTYRLKLSGNNLAQASTSRMLVESNKKKVFFQQKTEKKSYDRIKTQQVVYENSFKKITGQNQDLIESYNSLAMESKKIFDSLKKQKMSKGSQSKKQNIAKITQSSLTPFQVYLKNKSKKLKTEPVAAQLFEY